MTRSGPGSGHGPVDSARGAAVGSTGRTSPWLLGAVLAGGMSARLGRDKAAERVGDERMIDRAVETLRHVCPHVVVVSGRDDTPGGRWTVLDRERPGVGPLAGIETALVHAASLGATGVFVLACDLPLLDVPTVEAIADTFETPRQRGIDVEPEIVAPGGVAPEVVSPDAVAAARPGGSPDFEPLCAIYRASTLPVLEGLLDRGESAARRLFEAVGGVRVATAPGRLLNVNTEADLERAREETERR